MSYYDIDAILTDAQKIPCTFELDVPGLGYLDGNAGGTVKTGTKIDLPLWLGVMLAVSSGPGVKECDEVLLASHEKFGREDTKRRAQSLQDLQDEPNRNSLSNPLVTLDFPQPLATRVINALKADPKSIDLRAQATHFYALSARILDIFEDEDLIDVLIDTFRKRAAEIADHAHNPKGAMGEGAEFLRGLDEMERSLFRAAHDGPKGVKTWIADLKKTN